MKTEVQMDQVFVVVPYGSDSGKGVKVKGDWQRTKYCWLNLVGKVEQSIGCNNLGRDRALFAFHPAHSEVQPTTSFVCSFIVFYLSLSSSVTTCWSLTGSEPLRVTEGTIKVCSENGNTTANILTSTFLAVLHSTLFLKLLSVESYVRSIWGFGSRIQFGIWRSSPAT